MLIGGIWKFKRELTTISSGGKQIPIAGRNRSVDIDNLTVAYDANNNFTFAGKDPGDGCAGKFLIFNNGNSIKLFGCDIYERNPITAAIIELTFTRLTLSFRLNGPGFIQNSTLYFEK